MIEPKNLLIVRTDRIGDVVLTLPIAGIIKKYYPQCRLTFLVKGYTSTLTNIHPKINETIIIKESGKKVSILSNIVKLYKKKFDSCIVVYPTFKIALIAFLARIKNRVGTGYRWYSFLFTHRIYEHRKYAEHHELEYNVNLLKEIGIEHTVNIHNVEFDLKPDSKSEVAVDKKMCGWAIDKLKPVIIVHPGSGGSAIDLPAAKFSLIIEHLYKENLFNIIVTGNKEERDLCSQIIGSLPVINAAGVFELSELIALISNAQLLISNSTGPIHIAAALGKKIVGFYPKIKACSQERWGPYTEKKAIFTPSIDCNNCTREQCKKMNCMDTISVIDVINKTKELMEIKKLEF